jgi:N utilization substance protein B
MESHSVRLVGLSLMRRSRICAIQALYQQFFYKNSKSIEDIYQELYDIYREDFANKNLSKIININFVENLVNVVIQNQSEQNKRIESFLQDGWRIEDISELLLIILQLSTTEICYNDTDIGIIINEYIEITKIFGNVKEAKFVNNILQQVANQYRDE